MLMFFTGLEHGLERQALFLVGFGLGLGLGVGLAHLKSSFAFVGIAFASILYLVVENAPGFLRACRELNRRLQSRANRQLGFVQRHRRCRSVSNFRPGTL